MFDQPAKLTQIPIFYTLLDLSSMIWNPSADSDKIGPQLQLQAATAKGQESLT